MQLLLIPGKENQIRFLLRETPGNGCSDSFLQMCELLFVNKAISRLSFIPIDAPVMRTFWPFRDIVSDFLQTMVKC